MENRRQRSVNQSGAQRNPGTFYIPFDGIRDGNSTTVRVSTIDPVPLHALRPPQVLTHVFRVVSRVSGRSVVEIQSDEGATMGRYRYAAWYIACQCLGVSFDLFAANVFGSGNNSKYAARHEKAMLRVSYRMLLNECLRELNL
jgi:hypothetical protein